MLCIGVIKQEATPRLLRLLHEYYDMLSDPRFPQLGGLTERSQRYELLKRKSQDIVLTDKMAQSTKLVHCDPSHKFSSGL